MRFLCPKCKAKYQIADEKLEGRAVRMKCRKCGHVIEVPTPDSVGTEPASRAPEPAAKPRPPAPPKPAPRTAAVPPRPLAPSVSAAPRPPAPSKPTPSPAPVAAKQPSAPPDSASAAGPSAGLESAFSLKMREPQQSDVSAAIEVLSAGAAEEWYVGINGVPLGPVRLSILRQKAQQGVINEESLVWREGFEEWLPLRTFPELLVIVRESREMVGRASFIPSAPPPHSLSRPAPPPPRVLAPPPPAPPGVADEMEQEPRTVIASSPAGLAAVAEVASDPFAAAPAPSATPAPSPASAPRTEAVARLEDSLDEGARKSIVDEIAIGVRRQVRMHPAAYVLIAIAFGFGATGAIVFFTNDRGPAPPPTIQVVTVAAPQPASPADTAAPATSLAMSDAVEIQPGSRSGNGTRPSTESSNDKVEGSEEDKGSAPRKVGLGGGLGIDGPSVGGPSGGPGSNLPQQLDQSDIERVVAAHRASVKRGCWEPALASRDRNGPKSAKVTVSISIGPSGNVTSASASGGAGFPTLASCVAGRVRGWKFPPSAGTSQANIPFAFFSQ